MIETRAADKRARAKPAKMFLSFLIINYSTKAFQKVA
jgi:hypothetical protein